MMAQRSKWCERTRLVLVAGLALGFGAGAAMAADGLRISGSSSNLVTPDSLRQQKQVEKLINSIERRGPGVTPPEVPYVPPAPTSESPSKFRNKKLEEFIEQRQNWIYLTPDMLNKQSSSDDTFGVRNSDKWQSPTGNSKKVVERYFDSLKKEQSTANPNQKLGPRDGDSKDGLDGNSTDREKVARSGNGLDSKPVWMQNGTEIPGVGKTQEATLEKILSPGRLREEDKTLATSASADSFSALLHGSSGSREDRGFAAPWQSTKDFQQLLHPPKLILPVGGANDPVNLMPDTTRNSVQPVIPSGLDDLGRGTTRPELFGQVPNLDLRNRDRLSTFDLMNVKAFGASALPRVEPPASTLIQPKPGILPVPHRKF
jgi:hypothetical protein